MKYLSPEFFHHEAFEVAPDLIGKLLVVRQDDGTDKALRILETEVYYGEEDTACHARAGRTPRARVLYDRPGTLYIYLCYGIHSLLNVVTGEVDHPQGILIRACEGAEGPGKLTKVLGITTKLHGTYLADQDTIRFADDGTRLDIRRLPRVGIQYADKKDRERLWRYQAVRD